MCLLKRIDSRGYEEMNDKTQINLISHKLIHWQMYAKDMRFGQYLHSTTNFNLPEHMFYSDDHYGVYSELITMIEKGELK